MVSSGAGNGQVAVWIAENGTSVDQGSPTMSVSNLVNADVDIQTVFFGGFVTEASYSVNIYSDNVAVSTSWTGPTDYISPSIGEIFSSNLFSGNEVELNSTILDNTAVDIVIPSWNNTGNWVNQTSIDANGSNNFTALFTGTWNDTAGTVVSAIFYANDTSNNWIASDIFNFILELEPTPTPSPTPTATPSPTPTATPSPTPTATPSPTPTATPSPTPTPVSGLPTEALIGIAFVIILIVVIVIWRFIQKRGK